MFGHNLINAAAGNLDSGFVSGVYFDKYGVVLNKTLGWEASSLINPSVILDGSTYKMWYGSNLKIGYATSSDGITWTKESSPVLEQTGGQWDSNRVDNCSVIKNGSTYMMWYTNEYSVGLATSSDGITWTKEATNPVMDRGAGGQWDDVLIIDICVILVGSTYKIWYQASDGSNYRIGLATSSDGITWTKEATNPVLDYGAGLVGVLSPFVILNDDGMYMLWYSGNIASGQDIRYATSSDGITWTKEPINPIMSKGSSKHISQPCVVYDGTALKMWYIDHNYSYWNISLATSS